MADYDVIVIGGGLGGLSAGALLASQGRSVLLLEQSGRIGGCCSTFERDGYRFDVGASIVEIIQPIERVFEQLGTTLQKEVDLIACDPIMSYIFPDGERITYPLSVEETGAIIAALSPEDGRRWKDFVAFADDLMNVTLDTFFQMPASTMTDMAALIRKNPRFSSSSCQPSSPATRMCWKNSSRMRPCSRPWATSRCILVCRPTWCRVLMPWCPIRNTWASITRAAA